MKKIKRILAWIGIVLLLGMYVATFIFAMIDSPNAANLFKASIACTILIPVLLYAYMLVYKWTKGRGSQQEEEPWKK